MSTSAGQREWRRAPLQTAKAVGATVSFAATVIGLVFGLWPALKPAAPPASKGAMLGHVTLDQITFGQYLDRIAQSRSAYPREQLRRPGALVGFDFNIKGYRNKSLPLRWQMIDAQNGDQVKQSRDLSIVPSASEDKNSWSLWVAVPRGRDRRYFVEIELLDERGSVPLDRVRTRRFGGA